MLTGKRMLRLACAALCIVLLAGGAFAQEEKKERLSDHTLMSFYDSSLFVGDSQIKNFGNYLRKLRKKDPECFPTTKCYGAYSLQMRMLARKSPTSGNDVQLSYKGRNATLTSIAKAEKPRNVFIMIGLNDRIFDHVDRADRYIDQIMELRDEYFPETRIWFLSITPVTNKRKAKDRDKINEYNEWLKEKCSRIDADYMDICAGLTDEDGWMPKNITTDADCHFNDKGFDIFIGNLLDFAQAQYEAGLWEPAAE